MYRRRMFVLLIALLLLGCTATPRYKGVAQGGIAENVLGISVDENFHVIEIEADSAAQKAGVEMGDVLVSLTWVLSEAPAELASPEDGADAVTTTTPLTSTVTALRPPPGVENKTIPFTDGEGIRTLISYGVPLRLQVIRQGQALELTIIPAPRAEQADLPTTATPSTSRF